MIKHLHIHSYYSLLMGIPSPAQVAQAAVKYGMDAVALTETAPIDRGDLTFH